MFIPCIVFHNGSFLKSVGVENNSCLDAFLTSFQVKRAAVAAIQWLRGMEKFTLKGSLKHYYSPASASVDDRSGYLSLPLSEWIAVENT